MRNLARQFSRLIPPLLSLAVFALCAWAIRQELERYRPQDILQSIQAIPSASIASAIALVILSYLTLTGYDTLAVRFARHPLPYRRTALAAVLAYAISRTAGFSVLSGSAIRYRFYRRWGASNLAIAQIIAFCSLSFWVGLFAVGGAVFALQPPQAADLPLPEALLQQVGALGLAVTLAYFTWSAFSQRGVRLAGWTLPRLPLPLAIAQLGLTLVDWLLAAGILYVLLPATAYVAVLSAYLLAQFAGVFSTVPGGLGVFETVVLLTLSPAIASDRLLAALLVYRIVYFLLPLVVAIAVLVWYEVKVSRARKPNAGERKDPAKIR
ncbi:MAG: lysylphosphatidylglycerol synthase domain-containing protein [Elainellaceae cyanobacterium]